MFFIIKGSGKSAKICDLKNRADEVSGWSGFTATSSQVSGH